MEAIKLPLRAKAHPACQPVADGGMPRASSQEKL
jgi:hypothetical protein